MNDARLEFIDSNGVFRTGILCCCFLMLICCLAVNECNAWLFKPQGRECLPHALHSTKPKTVEYCLDQQIRIKNYPGILQLRAHARKMIRAEQNKLNSSRGIDPKELNKNIAPWLQIEKKATEFYKATVK
ncbi:MAG: hypothetical protein N3B18_08460 [Desulfobacterota bacterium]|nr:hypothetical protein [Thermodesulfobacteriota bacterium]